MCHCVLKAQSSEWRWRWHSLHAVPFWGATLTPGKQIKGEKPGVKNWEHHESNAIQFLPELLQGRYNLTLLGGFEPYWNVVNCPLTRNKTNSKRPSGRVQSSHRPVEYSMPLQSGARQRALQCSRSFAWTTSKRTSLRSKTWFLAMGTLWYIILDTYSRERLRRVFRKKNICTPSHLHINLTSAHLPRHTLTSAHLPFTSRSSFLSLLRWGRGRRSIPKRDPWPSADRVCRERKMQVRLRFWLVARNPLRRSCVSRARNAGAIAILRCPTQPSAEIVRVESPKCRWDCIFWRVRRNRLQRSCVSRARNDAGEIAFIDCNPLRRSWVSRARNAGETAFLIDRAQPSAEIVRVESAKCRHDCDFEVSDATLCGDRACREREMQVRLRFWSLARNPLRRSCVSRARNAGEIAFLKSRAQASAGIVRVESAKCRWDCVFCMLWGLFFLARYAGKIGVSRSLVENVRCGSVGSHFLRKSRVKRSFWQVSFSLFGKVSWKTFVLKVWVLSFWESLVENVRFGSLPSLFLRRSRGKRSFWEESGRAVGRLHECLREFFLASLC